MDHESGRCSGQLKQSECEKQINEDAKMSPANIGNVTYSVEYFDLFL